MPKDLRAAPATTDDPPVKLARSLARIRDRAVGWTVLHAMPRLRGELLASWDADGVDLQGRRRRLFRALTREIERAYYDHRTPTPRREDLRRLCQGPGSARATFEESSRPGSIAPPPRSQLLHAELEDRLRSGVTRSVHQVLCGSGHTLAQLAARHPTTFFCGSESDPAVVDRCRRRWRDVSNLAFATVRLEHLDERCESRPVQADLVVAEGGLHELSEERLRLLFSAMRRVSSVLLMAEPVDPGFDAAAQRRSMPRRRLSWNHPYPRYLRDAGWEQVQFREELLPGDPDEKLLVVFASDAAHARRAA